MTGSWTEVFSSSLAWVWSPGQFQTACLNPALPFLILCCPLVAICPDVQPEHNSNSILAGSQVAHEMNLKMPDERKGPNLECPSIPTLSPFPSYFSVPSILSSPFPALSIIRGSFPLLEENERNTLNFFFLLESMISGWKCLLNIPTEPFNVIFMGGKSEKQWTRFLCERESPFRGAAMSFRG